MATFRDKNGKILTREEIKRMGESSTPLTDEELEQATGGATNIQLWEGDSSVTCSKCGGDRFSIPQVFTRHDYQKTSVFWTKCEKCGHTEILTLR